MSKVKLGFLGCGFMGQLAHIANYMLLDSCEIVGGPMSLLPIISLKQSQSVSIMKQQAVISRS